MVFLGPSWSVHLIPWSQATIDFLLVIKDQICLFQSFQSNGIIKCVIFCCWAFALHTVFEVHLCRLHIKLFFFLTALHFVWIYRDLFSSVICCIFVQHLFQFLAVMNKVAMYICVQVSVWAHVLVLVLTLQSVICCELIFCLLREMRAMLHCFPHRALQQFQHHLLKGLSFPN